MQSLGFFSFVFILQVSHGTIVFGLPVPQIAFAATMERPTP